MSYPRLIMGRNCVAGIGRVITIWPDACELFDELHDAFRLLNAITVCMCFMRCSNVQVGAVAR